MANQAVTICLVLCLVGCSMGFLHKGHRRLHKCLDGTDKAEEPKNKLFFKGQLLEETVKANAYQSLVLECEVGGSPSPTIHWLKNGKRIHQGRYHSYRDDEASIEDTVGPDGLPLSRLATTRSRLFLDCVSEDQAAVYTCVGETPYTRISQDTRLKIDLVDYDLSAAKECRSKTSKRVEPARITQWTVSRLEFEGAKVQLLCRAEGSPTPTVHWLDREGQKIPSDSQFFRITKNGDLIIREASWLENMGTYTCVADNGIATDQQATFLYPMSREK